jgi:predicted metal-dependent hydrolase
MITKNFPEIIEVGRKPDAIKVNLRISLRSKRIFIRISPIRGVELVVPGRFNYDRAYSFLLSKEYWIKKQLKKVVNPQVCAKNIIPIFGKVYALVLVPDAALPVRLENKNILVAKNLEPIIQMNLKFFLRSLLKEEILNYADEICGLLNVQYKKISIKDTSSRWGSCTTKGNLAFSWRLIFAPKFIVKYVVIHELCHLIEMNHSTRFWQLVRNLCPDYLFARRWLRNNSSLLHSYLKSNLL